MAKQEIAAFVRVDVRLIRDVVSLAFEEANHVVFVAIEKFVRAVRRRIRPVERHLHCLRSAAVETVQRFSAPLVVRLHRRHTRLKKNRRWTIVIAHDEEDVVLIAARFSGELREIDATQPRRRNRQRVRIAPMTHDDAGDGIGCGNRLHHSRAFDRVRHASSAGAAVPTHAKNLDRVRWI